MSKEQFQSYLDRLNLSPSDFAKLIGVTSRTVNFWASGERSVPGPVQAYLRLFETLPKALREIELRNIAKEKTMLLEGIYGVMYTGQNMNWGYAMLIFVDGKVMGSVADGGKYVGFYHYNDQRGKIETEVKVRIPPGVATVTGVPAQPFEVAFNARASFLPAVNNEDVIVNTDTGPVNARINFLRSLPE
ncbi:MAG: hypothetical protein RIB59_11695 [Rhodospirillales bacterium]